MAKKSQNEKVKIGVIGGSGVYELNGIKNLREVKVKTPFGDPSDSIMVGTLEGARCAFLPRHGRGHRFLPTELPVRANIWALKSLGVEQVISVSACGSLREEIKPRDFVIPGQIYDRTKGRISSFYGNGIVGHVSFDEPFCPELSTRLAEASIRLGVSTHRGGTYVCMEGPAFSTKAESEVNRHLGFSIVGMTAIPEAKLAREAEMCYAMVALVTDYDVWKSGEEVSITAVVENLHANASNVKKLLKTVVTTLSRERKCACATASQYAIFTQPHAMNKATLKKLDLIIGKYVKPTRKKKKG